MRDPWNNKMFGATLLSGAISGITLFMVPGALFVGPGLLFGLATAWFFMTSKWLDYIQVILWIIASTAAWYAAMRVYSANIDSAGPGVQLTHMLQAGLVGSLILVVVLSLLVRQVSLKNILVTAAISVILAALMNIILTYGSEAARAGSSSVLPYARAAAAFAIWQAGVGLSLLAYKPKWLPRPKATRPLPAPVPSQFIVISLLVTILAIAAYVAYLVSPVPSKPSLFVKPASPPPSVCDFQNSDVGCGLDSFKVVAPNGGEQICLGSTYEVQWTAPADMETVGVVVGTPDTASNSVTLGTFPASQKQYDWHVIGIPVGSIYKMWLSSVYKAHSVQADSSHLFSVIDCS